MSTSPNTPRPGGHPGHHQMADVRASDGTLLARVDAEQAQELLRRGLITPSGRQHWRPVTITYTDGRRYDATTDIRLWARSRGGGSHTTIGADAGTWHRALKEMVR